MLAGGRLVLLLIFFGRSFGEKIYAYGNFEDKLEKDFFGTT
jgi:hypothetical protein